MHSWRHMRGVTLIELMIVVVVIAILASISYPSYREFVDRAKRNEARAALLKAAVNQERFYLQNNRFSQDMTELGFGDNPFDTENGAYRITVASIVPSADYTVTATYQQGGAEAAKCNIFTIDGTGVKTSSPDANCWTRTR